MLFSHAQSEFLDFSRSDIPSLLPQFLFRPPHRSLYLMVFYLYSLRRFYLLCVSILLYHPFKTFVSILLYHPFKTCVSILLYHPFKTCVSILLYHPFKTCGSILLYHPFYSLYHILFRLAPLRLFVLIYLIVIGLLSAIFVVSITLYVCLHPRLSAFALSVHIILTEVPLFNFLFSMHPYH